MKKLIYYFNLFSVLSLLFSLLGATSPPKLTPKETRIKIEEILKSHVSHHQLTEELIARSFKNYAGELDPLKTYFIKNEIVKWIEPSHELLKETLENIRRENFSNYERLHKTILSAIKRREAIELSLAAAEPLKTGKLQPADFKKMDWAKTEEELTERIANIQVLQKQATDKLDPEWKTLFIKRMEKRRLKREEELSEGPDKRQTRLILSLTLKSISHALDSQTAYYTPAEANQFMIQVQQKLYGIGVELRDDLNGFTVVRLLEGGPALEENKLRTGDRIIAVGREPVIGMEVLEAVELIRGQRGSSVSLTVLRSEGEKEEKLEIEVSRKEIILSEARCSSYREPFGNGAIGVLSLQSFYQDRHSSSSSDLRKAIASLQQEGPLSGIILDLRGNGGGLLTEAVAVTSLFIQKGIVVSIKDNTGQVQHLRNTEDQVAWDGPLFILTDRLSASSSEIVAQTLQDYGRALVIGDETFGKGTFQTFTLESAHYGKINPRGEFKVTRGCYYTVSGKSPQLVGVHPDLAVPGLYSQVEVGEKYTKYPLASDQIPPNFEDDLSDVPPIHRKQIAAFYKFNLQKILTTYLPYIDTLKKNSIFRIEHNENYQYFLKCLSKIDEIDEPIPLDKMGDLQMGETCNIMKDLLLLMQGQSSNLASA